MRKKIRKFEFLVAEGQQIKAGIIIALCATQSNHVIQTVVILSKLGLH